MTLQLCFWEYNCVVVANNAAAMTEKSLYLRAQVIEIGLLSRIYLVSVESKPVVLQAGYSPAT